MKTKDVDTASRVFASIELTAPSTEKSLPRCWRSTSGHPTCCRQSRLSVEVVCFIQPPHPDDGAMATAWPTAATKRLWVLAWEKEWKTFPRLVPSSNCPAGAIPMETDRGKSACLAAGVWLCTEEGSVLQAIAVCVCT